MPEEGGKTKENRNLILTEEKGGLHLYKVYRRSTPHPSST
jgi:hypothetical protein